MALPAVPPHSVPRNGERAPVARRAADLDAILRERGLAIVVSRRDTAASIIALEFLLRTAGYDGTTNVVEYEDGTTLLFASHFASRFAASDPGDPRVPLARALAACVTLENKEVLEGKEEHATSVVTNGYRFLVTVCRQYR